ncbi:MAG: PDZ domain-containing protein [Candidatus Rokubacteria bacterium]|nr:PDZ domain-containing protein [Candidatus Rokubacteria bacterium]
MRKGPFGLLLLAALALPLLAEAAEWGWLGVRIRDLSEQEMEEISVRHGIREGYGALIVEVLNETPAARSGLKNGDLVVAFKDRPVVDTRSLQRLVARTPVGEEVFLTVLRADEGRRRLPIRLGRMPPDVVAERIAAEFGFVIREPGNAQEGAPAPRATGAPSVGVVLRGSQADRAGLKIGDVILEINGRAVLSRQAVGEVLREAGLDQPLRLTVRREGEPLALTVSPPSQRIP